MLSRIFRKYNTLAAARKFRKNCLKCLSDVNWAAPSIKSDSISVHFLLGRSQVAMTALAACTFRHFSQLDCEYVFHDDGSLRKQDVDFLKSHVPEAKIWFREDADAAIEKKVNNTTIEKARETHPPLMLKLIDVFELSQSETVFFIDSDVLFFQPPIDLLNPPDESKWYFNKDISSAYIMNSDEARDTFGVELIEKINTGLWRSPRSLYSREFIIEVLEHPNFEMMRSRRKHVAEQTLAALLACRGNAAAFLPPTYNVSLDKSPTVEVCKHYVGKIRKDFATEGVNHLLNTLVKK